MRSPQQASRPGRAAHSAPRGTGRQMDDVRIDGSKEPNGSACDVVTEPSLDRCGGLGGGRSGEARSEAHEPRRRDFGFRRKRRDILGRRPCGFSRSGKVREGSTNTDTTGELLSAMGIVPVADVVRTPSSAPLHVRSRAFGPGPNRFPASLRSGRESAKSSRLVRRGRAARARRSARHPAEAIARTALPDRSEPRSRDRVRCRRRSWRSRRRDRRRPRLAHASARRGRRRGARRRGGPIAHPRARGIGRRAGRRPRAAHGCDGSASGGTSSVRTSGSSPRTCPTTSRPTSCWTPCGTCPRCAGSS